MMIIDVSGYPYYFLPSSELFIMFILVFIIGATVGMCLTEYFNWCEKRNKKKIDFLASLPKDLRLKFYEAKYK